MVAMDSGADNGFFYTGQVMHFSSPFTVFLIYHKHSSIVLSFPNDILIVPFAYESGTFIALIT